MLLVSFHDFRWTIDGNPAHDRYTSVPLRRKPAASAGICFPAIAIAGGDSFTVVDSLPECGTTKALRAGHFRRLALFDSSGLLWPVVHAVSTPSILDHLFNRVVRVALWVGDPRKRLLTGSCRASLSIGRQRPRR